MNNDLRVIIIEDSADDMLLIERELKQAGYHPDVQGVEAAEGLRRALEQSKWDLVIADYAMPHFDGLTALKVVREYDAELPFILISGKIGEETAVEVLKAGAHNYIMKDRIKLLGAAVNQSLQDASCQRQAREFERINRVLARAVEQSPVSILITDTNGNIQHVNPKLCDLTGYSPDDLIGCNPRIFKSGDTDPAVYQQLWESLLAGRTWHGVFHNRKKDGSLFWEEATMAPVRDDHGQIIQFVAVKEDISEKIRLEEALQLSHEDALCAHQAKLRFLNILSHELRTPLNAILGALQLSELDQAYDAEMTLNAKTALFSMLEMIDSILKASRIESGRENFSQEPLNLEQLLTAIGRLFTVAANNRHLALRMSLADNLPRLIQGDAAHLQQVLVHLVNNAIKFTEKGSVEVRIKRESRPHSDKHLLLIEVQDTGVGIDPEKQRLVFGLFTQADDSSTRAFGGIGLGLHLTKRLVELMGGTISLQSEVGKGSTFSVRLPLTASL